MQLLTKSIILWLALAFIAALPTQASVHRPHLYGHTEATVAGNTTTTWNAVRSSGYGAQPGTSASPVDATHDLATVLAWRGHYIDPTGFYYLGARLYDPQSGTFLSCDPLGHAASMDLYSYCGGDPVNGFDPDGRFGKQPASSDPGVLSQFDASSLSGGDSAFESQMEYQQEMSSLMPNNDLNSVLGIDPNAHITPSAQQREDENLSLALDAVPLIGSAKLIQEGLTGYDYGTESYVGSDQRGGDLLMGVVGLAPGASLEESAVEGSVAAEAEPQKKKKGTGTFSCPDSGDLLVKPDAPPGSPPSPTGLLSCPQSRQSSADPLSPGSKTGTGVISSRH